MHVGRADMGETEDPVLQLFLELGRYARPPANEQEG